MDETAENDTVNPQDGDEVSEDEIFYPEIDLKVSGEEETEVKSEPSGSNVNYIAEVTINAFEFCEIKHEIPSDSEFDGSKQLEEKCLLQKVKSNESDSDDDCNLGVLKKKMETERLMKLYKDSSNAHIVNSENAKPFPCSQCYRSYETRKKLRVHIRKVHDREKKCPICKRGFKSLELFQNHLNQHTAEKSYICKECPKENDSRFETSGQLKKHLLDEHGQGIKANFECHLCRKHFFTEDLMESHIKTHEGKKKYTCTVCGKVFFNKSYLKRHKNLHKESWKCDYCEKCFISASKLKDHISIHTGEFPYECDKCDRKFARTADYKYHLNSHLGVKPFACGQCGLRFTTSSSVTRHKANMHAQGPAAFACDRCPRLFYTHTRFNAHIKTHLRALDSNQRRVKRLVSDTNSTIAPSPVSPADDESSHQRQEIPLKAKQYKCMHCPERLESSAELERHTMEAHEETRRCLLCGKQCPDQAKLRKHIATHVDYQEKPHRCLTCHVGYTRLTHLRKHFTMLHPGEELPGGIGL